MKAIISHDVDHITVWEHEADLIVPKFLVRSSIELFIKSISVKEYYNRFKDLFKNKWQNIEELIEFDKHNDISSTFFIGVNNGLGLSYNLELSKYWIKKILEEGFDVGVHGIAYNNLSGVKEEFDIFKQISGLEKFGIRMHYLRNSATTVDLISKAGYHFDSTLYKIEQPYKIRDLWEFPLNIMDGYIIMSKGKKWQVKHIDEIMDETKKIIDNMYRRKAKYITILFHDRYFSDSFYVWKKWYILTIEYLKRKNIEFISYKDAIKEMEKVGKLER